MSNPGWHVLSEYRRLRRRGALAIEAWCTIVGRPCPVRPPAKLARCLRRCRRGVVRNIDAPIYDWHYGEP